MRVRAPPDLPVRQNGNLVTRPWGNPAEADASAPSESAPQAAAIPIGQDTPVPPIPQ